VNAADLLGVLDGYAGFVPGALITMVLAFALGGRVARRLGVHPIAGTTLVLAVGMVLSAVLTPSYGAIALGFDGSGTCDLTRFGLPSRNQLAWPGEILLNILLFVPLGVVLGSLPPSRRLRVLIPAAYALPVAIELAQLVVVRLGRECQSGDAIDNVAGLTIGIVAGLAIRWIVTRRNGSHAEGISRELSGVSIVTAGVAIAVLALATAIASPSPIATIPLTAKPTASPAPTPATNKTVRVDTVAGLLSALANNTVDEIVVADGTYRVSPAGKQRADSLWIGKRFAARTRAVTVRAETPGGVTFDGGGATAFGGVWFTDGAHHQTWDGFTFANGTPNQTGVIMFGEGSGVAPHHITLRNVTIAASCTGAATSATAPNTDHAIYVSQATEGPHDLRFEDVTVDGTGGLASAFHFYHSDATHRNAWNVTIRRLRVIGTQQAIMLWDRTLRDITIDGALITDALRHAVTYERAGDGIVLQNITSTGSGRSGFFSSLGAAPPGVTFLNNAFD